MAINTNKRNGFILITGGSGMLGSKISHMFIKNNFNVIIVKRKSTNINSILELRDKVVFYDIESIDLKNIFINHKINSVIHTATEYGRTCSYDKVLQCNFQLPFELLNLCLEFKVDYFFNSDTFFNTKYITHSYLPYYTKSKKIFLEESKKLVKDEDLKFINMKIEHMYACDDSEKKFVNWLCTNLFKNKDIDLTPCTHKRDFIFVSDVVTAFEYVYASKHKLEKCFSNFEVGTGLGTKISDFCLLAKSVFNSTSELNFGALEYKKNEIEFSCANNSSLKKLGWKSRITLEQGLYRIKRRMIDTLI